MCVCVLFSQLLALDAHSREILSATKSIDVIVVIVGYTDDGRTNFFNVSFIQEIVPKRRLHRATILARTSQRANERTDEKRHINEEMLPRRSGREIMMINTRLRKCRMPC